MLLNIQCLNCTELPIVEACSQHVHLNRLNYGMSVIQFRLNNSCVFFLRCMGFVLTSHPQHVFYVLDQILPKKKKINMI